MCRSLRGWPRPSLPAPRPAPNTALLGRLTLFVRIFAMLMLKPRLGPGGMDRLGKLRAVPGDANAIPDLCISTGKD